MKTAIVTGASGNLGQAVVNKFLAEGYNVVGTVIPNDLVPINFPSDNFEKAVVDLTDEDETQKFVNAVITKYETIDAAIFTVGVFAMGGIADTTSADILKQYRLNFETAYNIARPVFMQMLKQDSGRLFFIGARPGLLAANSEGMVAYGLAKSLVVRLTELINLEAKGKNVVASVVVPSTIDTPQNRQSMPETDFNKWVKPEDLNAHGTLFGGSLLRWIDEEAAIYSIVQFGNNRAVTKYISEINFVSSARQGDIIELGITATSFGNTSITLHCEVRNKITRKKILTIEKIVFVNLDEYGNPAPHGKTHITYIKDQFEEEDQ